jgi:predicted dehydrogenase
VKAVIVGVGGIGRRHARNLKRLRPSLTLTACRSAGGAADLGDDAALFDRIDHDIDAAVERRPAFAIVATPSSQHVDDALRLAGAGVHVFVEKPIAVRVEDAEALVAECSRLSLCLMVGYNLRFEPSLAAVKAALGAGRIGKLLSIRAEVGQYLPDWRPGRDYRACASAQAALGGGPLLELSHEFDYLRWLAGDVRRVTAQTSRASTLEIDVPDVADVLLEFQTGVTGSVHLDMLDRAPTRRCRLVGSEGTILWDALARSAAIWTADSLTWTPLESEAAEGDTYTREMAHYLACLANGQTPAVTGTDGTAALRVAVAAAESAAAGRSVTL